MNCAFPVFIYGFGLCLAFLGITDSQSLMHAAGQERDGTLILFLIVIASIIGFVEMAFHNRFPELKRQRHFILAALAFCFLSMLYVGYTSIRSDGVLIFYLWPGLCTMGAAILDARKRREDVCEWG